VKARLRTRVGNETWSMWLTTLRVEWIDTKIARLSVPNRSLLAWIDRHHLAEIRDCFRAELPDIVDVSLVLRDAVTPLPGAKLRKSEPRHGPPLTLQPPAAPVLEQTANVPEIEILPPRGINPFLLVLLMQQASDRLTAAISAGDIATLYEVVDERDRTVRIAEIQFTVCRHFDISRNDLLSDRRTWNVVKPRQIAMYLAKSLTRRSLPEIGRRFAGKDHTTVLHAVRKIEARVASDAQFRALIEDLTNKIVTKGETNDAIVARPGTDQHDLNHSRAEGASAF
jgi:chromosomal replication initiation ATPase DnaA